MKKIIPNILIVDDDQLYLTQFSTILTKEIQANYTFLNNPTDAFSKINENSYAVILLDVDMPGKNGFELASDIRKTKLNKRTPIIFITGISIDNNNVLEGYKVGAVDFLSKPVNKFILFSKIKTFLELDFQKNELLIARDKLNEININLEKQIAQRTRQLKKELNKNIKINSELKELANQLKENYHFLETLLETIPNPVYYKNEKGIYIGCNKAFEDFHSAKKEDIIGKTIYNLAPKEYADKITDLDKELFKSKENQISEIKFPVSNGNLRNLILYKNLFLAPDSNTIGIIGTIVDITELTRTRGLLNIQHTIDYLSSIEKGQKSIYSNIINSIFEFDWVDGAGIYLMDDEKQDLTLVSHKGLSRKFVNRSKYFPKESDQVKLVLSKRPFYSSCEKLGRLTYKKLQDERIKALAVIPLIYNEKIIGSLNLASKIKEEISIIDKRGIESLSSRIVNLIIYAQTQKKLKDYQKELELKVFERTKGLKAANLELGKEIEFHKRTKKALYESGLMYRSIFDNAQDGIALFDMGTMKIVEANNRAFEDMGYTNEEVINFKFTDLKSFNSEYERRNFLNRFKLKGHIKFQTKYRKKDGESVYKIISASIINLNDKEFIQTIIHDISELMEKEIALQKSEKRFRDLQSNIPIGMWSTTLNGDILYLNKAAKKMLGYSPKKKVTDLSILDIYFDINERDEFLDQIQKFGFVKNKEMQFMRKDKVVFWGNISATAAYDEKRNLIRIDGVIEDITERKEVTLKLARAYDEIKSINNNLEKEIEEAVEKVKQNNQYLLQKSKIESLGELAAGIAHEINQPLGVMSLSLENLQIKTISNKANPEYINEKFKSIESNIDRIRQIVDHIRTFSHEATSVSLEKVFVNEGISNALLLIGAQYKHHNIFIELDLQDSVGFTVGSKQRFEQVILNLLSNAKYAVEEQALNHSELKYKKKIIVRTRATKNQINISIEDNGTGIEPENLQKVFDPFYTSKPEGIGTGLGLSIVYGIIKEMRGEIVIDSKLNEYTKVKISFPRFPENN